MPRRREVPKRQILPDPLYHSQLVSKFVNVLMKDGKKSVAERILYDALTTIRERTGEEDPVAVFQKAIDNVKPAVEVKSRRVGGSTYQVPMEVRPARKLALAMRWLIQAAKGRGEKTMRLRLAGELLDAAENRGVAIKRKEDTHRMAEANRAFSHYRW
ncbi:MAG: 30S ribosomal protein S7 [Acidobacteriota bacterium]|nr:30S ribosomal protein S7 [Acidobacteriota bacterium]MDE2923696.1 30S ribosomal protein S7 [Acidobacteriota bacterium]MDE3265390.1 30S ribosomal protein S7 [Acidobacteriota bacterium]